MRLTYIGLAAAALTGVLAESRHRHAEGDVLLTRQLLKRALTRPRNATADAAELVGRQTTGRCGPEFGRCPGTQCCSDYGFCGETVDHCHPLFDCQAQYGTCGWPPAPPAPTTTSTTTTPPPPPTTTSTSTTTTSSISTTTTTPPPPPTTTTTSTSAPPSSPTATPTVPIPGGPLEITSNGRCGNGTMCIGNPAYGPCCSQHFWCGSSLEYCGAGCLSNFGACFGIPGQPPVPGGNVTSVPVSPTSTSTTTRPTTLPTTTTTTTPTTTTTRPTTTTSTTPTTTSTTAPPTPTVVIPPGMRSSTDGRCGTGVTCLGSTFGRCCSQFGWCGDGDQFCPAIVGCQPEFGYCDPR